jgi:hypothetical protein
MPGFSTLTTSLRPSRHPSQNRARQQAATKPGPVLVLTAGNVAHDFSVQSADSSADGERCLPVSALKPTPPQGAIVSEPRPKEAVFFTARQLKA